MTRPDQQRALLLAEALRTVAGVVMLTALAVAPLNYGSTRLMPLETLIALVATGAAAWALARSIARPAPPPPWPLVGGALLVGISAVAWWWFLSPADLPEFTRRHLARVVARWPYSVVPRPFPLVLAWGLTVVAALFALRDLAREAAWRRAIAGVMVLTGAAVALLGLAQNATGARGIYWDTTQRMPGAFFGPFFHHTAAGAYLNTVWPLALALALVAIHHPRPSPRTHALLFGSLTCGVLTLAAHAAHISRAPQLIALAALLGFASWAGLWRAFGRVRGLRIALGCAAVVLGAGVVAVGATRVGDIRSRWHQLEGAQLRGAGDAVRPPPESQWPRLMRDDLFVPSDHRNYPLGDRGATYAAAFAAIKAHPWFGWGPGGWTAAAAAYSADPFVRTFFLTLQFTHDDYLQAWIEWGLVGAAGWLLLFPGALAHAVARLGARPARDYLGAAAVVALAAVLIQSSIDFPLQIPAVQFNAVALAALAWSVPATGAVRPG